MKDLFRLVAAIAALFFNTAGVTGLICNEGIPSVQTEIVCNGSCFNELFAREITCWSGYVEGGNKNMKKITCHGTCGTRDTPNGGKVYGCHGDFPVKGGCLVVGGAMTCYCNESLCNKPQLELQHVLRFILANTTRNT